jgi:hypothetical protein
MRKLLIGVAIVAVLAAGAFFGLRFYGERYAEQALIAALLQPGTHGTVTHGALGYSIMDDRLDAEAVSVRSDDPQGASIKASHFTAVGLDPVGLRRLFSRGAQRLQDITATGLVIDSSPGVHLEIDQLAVSGIDPAVVQALMAGVASADAKGPLSPFASLTSNGLRYAAPDGTATVRAISLSGVKLTPPLPPLRQASGSVPPSVIDAFLAALAADKAVVEDADIQVQDGNKPHATVSRLEVSGLAPGRVGTAHVETLHVIDEPGSEMRLGSLDLANLAYPRDADVTPAEFLAVFAIDKGSLRDFDFKLMQGEKPHLMARAVDVAGLAPGRVGSAHGEGLGVSGDGAEVRMGGLDLVNLSYAPEAVDDPETLLTGLSFEKWAVSDADVQLPQEPDQPHLSLHGLEFGAVAPGQIGSGRLDTLGLTTKDGLRLHLGGVRFGSLAYRLDATSRAKLSVPELLGMFVETFGIEDLSGSTEAGTMTLASYEMKMAGNINAPTGFDMTLRELAVDLSAVKDLPAGLTVSELGTSKLVLNADAHTTYDPKAKVMDIPRYAFELPKLGSLTIAARFGNFLANPTADPSVALERLMAANLQRLEIRYDDDSLVSRLLAIAAREDNKTVEQKRASFVALLQQQRAIFGPAPATLKMLDTLIAFVRQPKTITIALDPHPPLPFTELNEFSNLAPADIVQRIGLSVH